MNNVLQLPTELSHFQASVSRDRIAAAHLLQMLVARRVQWLRENGVFSAVARVGTKENLWADLISRRGGEAVFLEQVWALGMEPVKVEVDGRWRDTSYLQGAGADPA